MKQAKLASGIYQTTQKVTKKRRIFAQTAVVFKYMPGRRKAGGTLETDGVQQQSGRSISRDSQMFEEYSGNTEGTFMTIMTILWSNKSQSKVKKKILIHIHS